MRNRELVPVGTALLESLKLPSLISNKRLHGVAARVHEQMVKTDTVLSDLLPRFKPSGQRLANVGDEDDLRFGCRAWSERTASELFNNNVGHIVMDEKNVATCTFYEEERDLGFLDRECRRIRHVHRVPDPRFLKVGADINIPPRGKEILAQLDGAGLTRYVRILHGQLIGEQVTVDETWKERTSLGKGVDATVAATKKVGKGAAIAGAVIGGGILAVAAAPLLLAGGAATAATAAAGAVATPILAGDPVICIGDVAIWGWVE